MDKISIVIPVYNVEKYLADCLNSVIDQTYKNIEIILVNDGSTDKCPQICDLYAAKDSRIKVIHKENGGLSDARNMGLRTVTGDYAAFIDSDDILSPHFCEIMVNAAQSTGAEIVECGFVRFTEAEEISTCSDASTERIKVYQTYEALTHLMLNSLKQMACNKLFKSSVLGTVFFEVGRKHEDEFWTYQIIAKAKLTAKISAPLYFYRQHNASIMGLNYNQSRLDGLLALEYRIQFMKHHFPELIDLAIKIFCFASLYHYQQILKNRSVDEQKAHRINIIQKYRNYFRGGKQTTWSFKEKFWLHLFRIFPDLCAKIRNRLKIGI